MSRLGIPRFFSKPQSVRLIVAAISATLIAYSLLGGTFPVSIQYGIVFILVGVVGMAHGSIDHIIAKDVLNIVPRRSTLLFVSIYLGVIALYVALWYISPLISFILFIAYSSFHFGQADTEVLAARLSKPAVVVLGTTYGLFIISAMVFFNTHYTTSICPDWFMQIIPKNIMITVSNYIFYISLLSLVVQLIYHGVKGKTSWLAMAKFIIQLSFVLVGFMVLPPLVAFSVYFGLWHALLVLKKEYKGVRKLKIIQSFKHFIRALTPFTLISLVAMLLIIYLGSKTAHFTTIIAISVLAFPHTILMHLLYNKKTETLIQD